MDDRRAAKSPAAACNPRQLAVRRKRQAVAGTIVAFGATVALVLSHPVASDASNSASNATGTTGTGGTTGGQAPVTNSRPVAPQGNSSAGQPAQPGSNYFTPSQGSSGTAPAPQLRPGGRRGSVGSGGS